MLTLAQDSSVGGGAAALWEEADTLTAPNRNRSSRSNVRLAAEPSAGVRPCDMRTRRFSPLDRLAPDAAKRCKGDRRPGSV